MNDIQMKYCEVWILEVWYVVLIQVQISEIFKS